MVPWLLKEPNIMNIITNEGAAVEAQPIKIGSKSDTVQKLLARIRGATIEEIGVATSWQPHSIRAFLSGLRKKGKTLLKEERKDGTTAYRMAKVAARVEQQAS